MTAVAGFATTYASHTPYLTYDEWVTAPTAIDTSDLLPNGTPTQQQQLVQNKIEGASSWVDRICHQVLAATVDTHRGRYLVNQWGTVKIPLPRKPVLEVLAVLAGHSPSVMTPLTSLVDIDIGVYGVIEVPIQNVPYARFGSGGSRPIVQVIYINGFPNTTTTADAAIHATSLLVTSGLGIYPGTVLSVYDTIADNEHVTVASTYVAGSLTVPLVAPTAYAHAAGVSVSNLPPTVKEAAILLTSALIQTRGSDAIVLDSMDTPTKMQAAYGANADAERLAAVLLGDLIRVR